MQPLAQQVRQVQDALSFLGQPLSPVDTRRINAAIGESDEARAVVDIEQALDPYVLAVVTINAESRVKVEPAVNQCWTQKAPKISARELPDARQAYDHAQEVYRKLIAESEE